MNALQAMPFLGLLVSVALLPGLAPRFWLRRMGWVALGWCLALLVLVLPVSGWAEAWHLVWHALLVDYLPFVTTLGALYTVSGGILVCGGPAGTPAGNTVTLAGGMLLGLLIGPTGAAMVLIQPLLAANAHRREKRHLVLFLIILVANISGALSPIGNPPLFAGMLRGVPFLWPAHALLLPYLMLTALLLGAFYLLDRWFGAGDAPGNHSLGQLDDVGLAGTHGLPGGRGGSPDWSLPRVRGWPNVLLVIALGLSVVQQGLPLPVISLLGERVGTGRLAGSAVAVAVAALSWLTTARTVRQATDFTWHPMAEVAVLFAGIFVTLAPVSGLLQAGPNGPLGGLLRMTEGSDGQPVPLAYFWLTGLLSAFLDNAPTYLVLFDLAGVRPQAPGPVLAAISAGAVFFGGLTYIGNAPNLMLRGIAAHRGVRMPDFAAYLAMATAVLLPAFVVLSLVFFW